MSKEPQAPASHYCDEDPGVVFILWPTVTGATTIHACLGLPSVGNLQPPLQQGRRIAIEGSSVITNLMVCFMLPGATPEKSVSNLSAWLDNVMIGLGYSSSLAMAPNGQRIPGVFHHLGKEECSNFRGHLGNLTRHWHIDCLTNNLSAGYMVELAIPPTSSVIKITNSNS